jgi:hypothetical protein
VCLSVCLSVCPSQFTYPYSFLSLSTLKNTAVDTACLNGIPIKKHAVLKELSCGGYRVFHL